MYPFWRHISSIQNSVAYSPDGKHIVSSSCNKTIMVWDVTTGQTVAGPFQGHRDHVSCVAYSPDGKYIVSGSWDKTIRVWDTTTGQTVAGPFLGHTESVISIAYSPDGKYIVSGSDDKSIKLWNIQTLVLLHSLSMIDGWIQASNNLVFGWVAPWNRPFHWFPSNSLIISPHGICQTNIDCSLFGESWMSCWN